MSMRGIDVSVWNDSPNWQAIKDFGIQFVMIRCTMGKSNTDEMFLNHYNGARSVGLKVGAYHYSYALTPDDAIIEANHCRDFIASTGCLLELPVFFDMEDADGYKAQHGFYFERNYITSICKAFIDNLQLRTGVYASESWLNDYIDWRSLGCPVWNASWISSTAIKANPQLDPEVYYWVDGIKAYMWQFTDSLRIAGKYYDGNFMYGDQY